MRKLALVLAATLAMMAAGARSDAFAMTPAGVGLRAAVEESAVVDQVHLVCTYFWNGHWHHSQRCLWVPGHYRHHHHHHRHHDHRFY